MQSKIFVRHRVARRLPAEALAAVAAGTEPPNADTLLLAAIRSWYVGSQKAGASPRRMAVLLRTALPHYGPTSWPYLTMAYLLLEDTAPLRRGSRPLPSLEC